MNSIILTLFLLGTAVDGNVKVAGVTFTQTLKKNNINFVLNGTGLKTRYFIDLYVAGLYLPKKSKDASHIIYSETPMVLKIVITSSFITLKKFKSSVDEWFFNSMHGNISEVKNEIEMFKSTFGNSMHIYDELLMIYHPNLGIKAYKNGTYVTLIPGLAFKRELARLWLDDNPESVGLKNGLLGISK